MFEKVLAYFRESVFVKLLNTALPSKTVAWLWRQIVITWPIFFLPLIDQLKIVTEAKFHDNRFNKSAFMLQYVQYTLTQS